MTSADVYHRLERLLRASPIFAGVASTVLGVFVLVGWYTHTLTLVQVHPAFAPMPFNNAVGFLVCGVGLLATVYHHKKPGVACGAVLAALGLLTLAEYVFEVELGINQLFVEYEITDNFAHPRRMAPNTVLCFALSATALLVANWPRQIAWREVIVALLGSITFSLGAIALFGHVSNVEGAFGWAHFTRMAAHTAIAFGIVGAGMLAHAVGISQSNSRLAPRWLPVPCGIAVLTISLALWQALVSHQQTQTRYDVAVGAEEIANEIEVLVEPQVLALRRMADRWVARGGTPQAEWEADALQYAFDQPGVQAVEWVDSTFQVRWVVPLEGNEQEQGLKVAIEERRLTALEAARERQDLAVSRSVDLHQGGVGFHVNLPLYVGGRFDGFIVGVFDVEKLLNSVVHRLPADFVLRVFEGDREIYRFEGDKRFLRSFEIPATADERWGREEIIEFHGIQWILRVVPLPALLARNQSLLPNVALIVGLFGAILLSLALHVALTNRRHALWDRAANRLLQDENRSRIRAVAESRVSEQRFRDFGEVASDWFWETGPDGRFTQFSGTQFEEVAGVPAETVLGLTHAELLTERLPPSEVENTAKWEDLYATLSAQQSFRDFEYLWRRTDGRDRYFSISGRPVLDEAGTFFGYRGIGRDLTHLKEQEVALQQSEERFSKAFRLSPNLLTLIDAKLGTFKDVNDSWRTIMGYERDELVGQTPQSLDVWAEADVQDAFFTRMRQDGAVLQSEARFRTKERAVIDIVISGETIELDGRSHWLVVAADITQQKLAENRIRVQAEQLEEQNRELARSNEELDDFAYIVSHDLKEPLRGISNYATFLLEDYADKLDDEGRKMLNTLPHLTKRLEAFIEDLLHYSRAGRTELGIEETNLKAVVDDVVESIQPVLDEAGVEIRFPADLPTIRCDVRRVGQVFYNLITNAAKYNDKPEKWVEIGSRLNGASVANSAPGTAHHEAAETEFYVRDNGIGIADKHHNAVFKIFRRLHGRDQYGGGTGAGLTIARKIVEHHGGRIWLDSTPGEGTTFFFTLGAEQSSP